MGIPVKLQEEMRKTKMIDPTACWKRERLFLSETKIDVHIEAAHCG
jgi:hypothetical protein